MSVKFLYFDLGMVLLNFSVERMCRQMAEVAGITPTQVSQIIFDGDLQQRYERGEISSREFYEALLPPAGACPDYDRLASAASDIFELNGSIVPVVAQLRQAGYRLGILSNTCENHWQHCFRRFRLLGETFSVFRAELRVEGHEAQRRHFPGRGPAGGRAARRDLLLRRHRRPRGRRPGRGNRRRAVHLDAGTGRRS